MDTIGGNLPICIAAIKPVATIQNPLTAYILNSLRSTIIVARQAQQEHLTGFSQDLDELCVFRDSFAATT